ncbi:NAD(P)H-binding protein [Streptomyces sp. ODS28]|uniref:NAD(P)H-binding protein n=1 Tax=Streptomyces sp. ODS28 TaxID=3136688 RepID=UPI0031EC861E
MPRPQDGAARRESAESAAGPGPVVVTGATGTVGSLVAGRLAAAGVPVRALTRDPVAAARAGVPGDPVRADFADGAGLARAFAGADAVFVVTGDPLEPRHDENVIEAARRSGVRHLVKLSALAVDDPGADDVLTEWQRENEQRLAASGLVGTLLRPRAFMTNTLHWAPGVRSSGTVRALHADSRNACVDPADIADVAVRVLTDPEAEGRAWDLTGPEPVSARDQAARIAEATARPVRCEELTVDEALAGWRRHLPEVLVQARLRSAERQRAGAKERVADGVAEALGRPPGSYAAWARKHADAFR